MTDNQYYRLYNSLQKKHERISYRIVRKGLKKQFEYASTEYLKQPKTPIELLVREADTREFIKEIYLGVGLEFAELVDRSLNKYKSFNLQIETKAVKPKEYKPTNNPNNINIWRDEFIRLTQTKEIGDKVTKVTETTKNQIRAIVKRGVEEKLSHKQIAQLILAETDSIKTKQRALTIARTENAVGSNKGAIYAGKTSGLVLYKKWIARSVDGKTREAHLGMVDSTPIPMDAFFSVGGEKMSHPCDGSNGAGAGNIVNCRCVISLVPASRVINPVINKPVKPKPVEIPKPVDIPKPQSQIDFSKPIPMDFEDLSTFRPANTIDEATIYAIDKGFGQKIDYSWTNDIKVANEFNRVLFNLKQRFNYDPLAQIGSKAQKGALMSANFKTLNVKHSYWKSEKIIFNNFQKNVEDFKGRITRNIEIAKANYELTKRFAWKLEVARLENQLKFSRWTIKYSKEKYLESTIHHEFGHVLHDQLIGGLNGDMALNNIRRMTGGYSQMARELNTEHIRLFKLAQENGDIYKISAYGASNNKEFFSETFVMYMAKDPELPIYLLEFFDKLFRLTKI